MHKCHEISASLPLEFSLIKSIINSYTSGLSNFIVIGIISESFFAEFSKWWGRGMQYINYQKNLEFKYGEIKKLS